MIEVERQEADSRWLNRLALRLVHNQADADDIVQETLTVASQSSPIDSLARRPWLKRIATNVVRMKHRSNTRRLARESSSQHATESKAICSAELLQQKQASKIVYDAMQTLSEAQRTALLLRFVEDLSIEEVANKQGVAIGTADSRIRKGLKNLRSELDQNNQGDARPWLLLLCPGFDISVHQVAQATTTGVFTMTKFVVFVIALLSLVFFVGTQRDTSASIETSQPSLLHSAKLDQEHEQVKQQPKRTESIQAAIAAFQGPSAIPAAVVAPLSTADLPASPTTQFWFDKEQNVEVLNMLDAEHLSSLYQECFTQYAQRVPTARPNSDILLDVHIVRDQDMGVLATEVSASFASEEVLDDGFIECLEESSYGLDFKQIPSSLQQATLKVALTFLGSDITQAEQREGLESCVQAFSTKFPGKPNSIEYMANDTDFEDCITPFVAGHTPGIFVPPTDSDSISVSNTEMQPCLLEAKKRIPNHGIKRIGGELTPTADSDALLSDETFNRCMAAIVKNLALSK